MPRISTMPSSVPARSGTARKKRCSFPWAEGSFPVLAGGCLGSLGRRYAHFRGVPWINPPTLRSMARRSFEKTEAGGLRSSRVWGCGHESLLPTCRRGRSPFGPRPLPCRCNSHCPARIPAARCSAMTGRLPRRFRWDDHFFENALFGTLISSRIDTRMSTGSMGAKTLKAQMMTFQSAIIALWIALWRNSLYYVYL